MSDQSSQRTQQNDLSGEVELADGEVVTIPRTDNVFPTFGETSGSVQVVVQQGRIKMSEEDECEVSLGGATKSIDDPTPYATLFANINCSIDDDDLYAELAFDSPEAVRELRDMCDLYLRYRGDDQ